jgi:hypothetical protein
MVHFFNWLPNLTRLLLAPCPLADFGETAARRSFFMCCMLRCIGRDWHLTDNPAAPAFVGYRSNNGQKAALGLHLSAAIDPEATFDTGDTGSEMV